MRLLAILVAGVLLVGGAALADENSPQPPGPPLKLPAHTQPTERQIEQLPTKDKANLSVDLSHRNQKDVDELYQQLTGKPPVPNPAPAK